MPTWKPRDTARAQALRRAATPAERLLWRHLSRTQAGAKFSRQMPVGPFFADFLCRELSLVVELDGFAHAGRADYDAARDRWFASRGYRVLRFANAEVLRDPYAVAARIAEEVGRLAGRAGEVARLAHPQPLPQAGGEHQRPPDPPGKPNDSGTPESPLPLAGGAGVGKPHNAAGRGEKLGLPNTDGLSATPP